MHNIYRPKPGSYALFFLLALLLVTSGLQAQSYCSWALGIGGKWNDEGNSVLTDQAGNVYVVGVFQDTADFDPGPGVFTMTVPSTGYFVAKYTASGSFTWAKKLPPPNGVMYKAGVQLDQKGNIYITGNGVSGDYDPGPGTLNLPGGGFLVKLNTNGDLVWVKRLAESSNIRGAALAIDSLGFIYNTGIFFGTVDFDPGPGTYNLTSQGDEDAFISKTDSAGNLLWVKAMGGTTLEAWNNAEQGNDIALDAACNVYITGWFKGSGDFDPGPGTHTLTSNGNTDIFVCKLDSAGNFVWANQTGGTDFDFGYALAVDSVGNVYTSGYFYSNVDFDPGPGVYSIAGSGFFVAKYNTDGKLIWAKSPGFHPNSRGKDMEIVSPESVYLLGEFNGTVDFDFGPGSYPLASLTTAAFILKLDSAGGFEAARQFYGTNIVNGTAFHVDKAGYIYTTGRFNGQGEFDPDPNQTLGLNSFASSTYDLYISKYRYFPDINFTQTDVSCKGGNTGSATANVAGPQTYTYLWNNGQNTKTAVGLAAGTYTVKITDASGCYTSAPVTIAEPARLELHASSLQSNCSGPCNGSATVSATGGVTPYTYLWDPTAGSQITATAAALCIGSYTVTVTDKKGCTAQITEKVDPKPSTYDPQVYLTNLAAVDQVNVSPSFAAYYNYNLPATITPPPSNPRNFVDPGKKARFKVECTNKKSNGQSVVSGICKVRINSPYITLTDSSSALNNIGWSNKAWSADEFEIDIHPDMPEGTNAYIDFIVQENGQNYATTCIAIPVRPLVYSPTTALTVDDDNNPDSKGNDNDICDPDETIEFYPWLDNISNLDAEYVRGRLENLDNHSYINIWNNVPGVGTTVYDVTWWNYAFAAPQMIGASAVNTTPEYDFVFDYNSSSASNFKLYLVMAGGFNLFSENALSLVQWTLPYTFDNTGGGGSTAVTAPEKETITVYPNPAAGVVHFTAGNAPVQKVSLYNATGTLVYQGGTGIHSIDLSGYAKGVYLLQLQAGDKHYSKKIIVQ